MTHSAIAISAYIDLLRSLREEQVAAIRGAPALENRGGKLYWYETLRIGNTVRKRYIGENTPELATMIAAHRDLAAAAADRATHRMRLVRILRAEGMTQTDRATGSLLSAMAQAGVFRLGGTIVGTHAFRLYEGELGLRIPFDDVAQTDDLDIAQFERLSLALDDQVETALADTFKSFAFAPVPTLQGDAVWRWRQTRSNTLIEFLTPSFRDDEDIRPLPALGVSAQSLHFLNYLIADPIKAAALYRSGILVQIPRPERFAIHKLIVADRRRTGPDQIKSIKDRAQAALLIRALAQDRPDELAEAYHDALSRGAKWGERIAATLKRMPETAATLNDL